MRSCFRCYREANLAAVVGQLQLGEQSTGAGRLRVDSREILAATTRLVGARLGELEVDTHIVVTTRYIERGTPDDFMADLTKGGVVRALYGPSKSKHGGKNLENVHRALVNLYRLEVQFEGFNAITGEHDPDLASMSRLYTDLVFDRQIRQRLDQQTADLADELRGVIAAAQDAMRTRGNEHTRLTGDRRLYLSVAATFLTGTSSADLSRVPGARVGLAAGAGVNAA